MLIAGLTLLSRMLGLLRTLVFSQTVGASCLGTAYVTANQVPNLDLRGGPGGRADQRHGAGTGPLGRAGRSDPAEKARVGQITSALLTWSVIILVPLTLVIVAAAGPIASLLNPANANAHCVHAEVVAATGHMLEVFAPQVVLYGLSVVLYGLLQAYRRFTGPALGRCSPAWWSSLLISPSCRWTKGFRWPGCRCRLSLSCRWVPRWASPPWSWWPGAGVAAAPAAPARLRFPPGVARRAGGLALVGVVELIAIDLASWSPSPWPTGAEQLARSSSSITPGRCSAPWRGAGHLDRDQRVPCPFRPGRAGVRPDLRRVDAGGPALSWLGTAVIAAIAVPAAHVLARQPDQVSS